MRYQAIVVDPPWPYRTSKGIVGNGGRGNYRISKIKQVGIAHHYPSMSIEALCKLKIPKVADTNCALYLWTTNLFMKEAFSLLESWKFDFKTILTWVKVRDNARATPSMKTGYYYRGATEHCLFAIRGKIKLKGSPKPTAFLMPRLGHSVKPQWFYSMIEKQLDGPYLDVFARKKRKNWDTWGNECENDVEL